MSNMTLMNDTLRVNYRSGNNFVNISTYNDWATTIWQLDNFNYWLVIRFTDGRYSPHQIICVPSIEWFEDWSEHEDNKDKFEIVYNPQDNNTIVRSKE